MTKQFPANVEIEVTEGHHNLVHVERADTRETLFTAPKTYTDLLVSMALAHNEKVQREKQK